MQCNHNVTDVNNVIYVNDVDDENGANKVFSGGTEIFKMFY